MDDIIISIIKSLTTFSKVQALTSLACYIRQRLPSTDLIMRPLKILTSIEKNFTMIMKSLKICTDFLKVSSGEYIP